jgi:hypothetical protein
MRKPLPEPAEKDNALFKFPYEVVKWELLKTAMDNVGIDARAETELIIARKATEG